jgi:hypothetical protein
MQAKNEIRWVNSKKTCTCAETGETIHTGERCLYDPTAKPPVVYHAKSKRAKEFKREEERSAQ